MKKTIIIIITITGIILIAVGGFLVFMENQNKPTPTPTPSAEPTPTPEPTPEPIVLPITTSEYAQKVIEDRTTNSIVFVNETETTYEFKGKDNDILKYSLEKNTGHISFSNGQTGGYLENEDFTNNNN